MRAAIAIVFALVLANSAHAEPPAPAPPIASPAPAPPIASPAPAPPIASPAPAPPIASPAPAPPIVSPAPAPPIASPAPPIGSPAPPIASPAPPIVSPAPPIAPPALAPGLSAPIESHALGLRAPKRRGVAVALSLVGTVAPLVVGFRLGETSEPELLLTVAGLSAVFLPSAGHWYTGRVLTTGLRIRMVGVGVAAMALIAARLGDTDRAFDGAVVDVGLVAIGVGALWDLESAPKSVDAWNREHASELAPTAMKIGTGYGLGVAGRF